MTNIRPDQHIIISIHFLLFFYLLIINLFFQFIRKAYISFGGLLMRLHGDANNLHGFKQDANVYLLMKKLAF